LTVNNGPPVFVSDTVKDMKIMFNQTTEYKLPSYADPEGMPVYITLTCSPSCTNFYTVKTYDTLVFSPNLFS